MYTLALMSALSSAPDAAEFHGYFRRLFSFRGGCCGGSCTGSGYGSCTGGGSRLRAYTSCCGGTGRGYGSCTGSAFAPPLSCSGGMTVPTGFDGGFATPTPAISNFYYPSFYPADGSGCFGSGPMVPLMPAAPGLQQPLAPPTPAGPPPEVSDSPRSLGTSYAGGGRATVVVRLPADAVLFAEGRRLTLTGAERTFTTPPLPAGDWTYLFRAEYTRDGETISRTKRVGVRPGDALALEFSETGLARTTQAAPRPVPAGLAATVPPVTPPVVPTVQPPPGLGGPEPARLTIKLPPGATLTVDGKRLSRGGEFRTPPLAPGKEYRYQMQAELVSNGRPERQTTTVPVRAGELVSLDFTAVPR